MQLQLQYMVAVMECAGCLCDAETDLEASKRHLVQHGRPRVCGVVF